MDRVVTADVNIHPSAVVDDGATIGPGSQVWHFSHVSAGAVLGARCKLGQNVFVGQDVRIGNGVKIQNNVSVYAGVTLEEDVFCGPSAVFTNVRDPRAAFAQNRADCYVPTRVRRGATIGANATIVCGVTIGEQAFIGAGAVVTRDVPSYALVYGNPARVKGWMCRCGERLALATRGRAATARCARCGTSYRRQGDRVVLQESIAAKTRSAGPARGRAQQIVR